MCAGCAKGGDQCGALGALEARAKKKMNKKQGVCGKCEQLKALSCLSEQLKALSCNYEYIVLMYLYVKYSKCILQCSLQCILQCILMFRCTIHKNSAKPQVRALRKMTI